MPFSYPLFSVIIVLPETRGSLLGHDAVVVCWYRHALCPVVPDSDFDGSLINPPVALVLSYELDSNFDESLKYPILIVVVHG